MSTHREKERPKRMDKNASKRKKRNRDMGIHGVRKRMPSKSRVGAVTASASYQLKVAPPTGVMAAGPETAQV